MAVEADDWRWSSARAHLRDVKDGFSDTAALAGVHRNWGAMLRGDAEAGDADAAAETAMEAAMRSGRPLGDEAFVEQREAASGRALKRGKPGPSPRAGIQVSVLVPVSP